MKIIAVEASGQTNTVAVWMDGKVSQISGGDGKAHAETFLPMVSNLLQQANLTLEELDGFAVGRGPGGFTGLRVAVAVVQGLAYSVNKPVLAVPTLAAIAQSVACKGPVVVCTDARKGQVYSGVYVQDSSGGMQLQGEELVCDPDAVVFPAQEAVGAGNGYAVYPELVSKVSQAHAEQEAEAQWVAHWAALYPDRFEPAFRLQPEYVRNKVTHGS